MGILALLKGIAVNFVASLFLLALVLIDGADGLPDDE
jgi:hypothetical protein